MEIGWLAKNLQHTMSSSSLAWMFKLKWILPLFYFILRLIALSFKLIKLYSMFSFYLQQIDIYSHILLWCFIHDVVFGLKSLRLRGICWSTYLKIIILQGFNCSHNRWCCAWKPTTLRWLIMLDLQNCWIYKIGNFI